MNFWPKIKYKTVLLVSGIKIDYRGIIADIKWAELGSYKYCCTYKSLSQGVNCTADYRTLNLLKQHSKASTGGNTENNNEPYCSDQ